MAPIVHLDTHVVFWLYLDGASASLSRKARALVQVADELRVSPMVRLELQFLFEVGKTRVEAASVLDELSSTMQLRFCDAAFEGIVAVAEEQSWTRDPFDRMIVAQARLANAPLVTKDRSIRKHYSAAVW